MLSCKQPIEIFILRGLLPICSPAIMDEQNQMPSCLTICRHHDACILSGFNALVPHAVPHADGLPQMSRHLPASPEPCLCPGRSQSLRSARSTALQPADLCTFLLFSPQPELELIQPFVMG
ncbi:hypothetical protein KOW79_001594 [Hemibagrus wyckioides]|uniref:Uncharacterized protein n=1 Tax=Hemibagrus wyckioides TaxID=337641 RepID=A0A9D3SXT9_9TELE|nr:hypothetical protein KOW79_001594 [Hemibagrus wyckioides]